MAGDLDDIRANTDCPRCGELVSVSYRDLRLLKAASCACGALLRLEDGTSIAAIQALIDAEDPPVGDNDA